MEVENKPLLESRVSLAGLGIAGLALVGHVIGVLPVDIAFVIFIAGAGMTGVRVYMGNGGVLRGGKGK